MAATMQELGSPFRMAILASLQFTPSAGLMYEL
jgi:hypothetical protein